MDEQGWRVRIGAFELDPRSGDLWRDGRCRALPEQPLAVLKALLHPSIHRFGPPFIERGALCIGSVIEQRFFGPRLTVSIASDLCAGLTHPLRRMLHRVQVY